VRDVERGDLPTDKNAVATAKGCGLEPYGWLRHVLIWLSTVQTVDGYEKRLPWNVHSEDLAEDLAV